MVDRSSNTSSTQGISSPDHLKRWLVESNRKFIVMLSEDLVDSLPWPDGVEAFQRMVTLYRERRQQIAMPHNEGSSTPFKDEQLTRLEMQALVLHLLDQLAATSGTARNAAEHLREQW